MGRQTCALLACGLLLAGTLTSAQRGPAAAALHLDPEVLALACAPAMVYERPMTSLRVTGGQDSAVRVGYAPGDLITINAGTDNGIDVGQEFYVRRVLPNRGQEPSRAAPGVVQTTGWIKVYAVDPKMSLATITHACDTIDVNDYLDPFTLPVVPAQAGREKKPQKENYGRILLGADRRRAFGSGDFFVVDRGSDHGVTPGAQFVIFRDKLKAENFLYELGEAVAVDVRSESSTLKVTLSRDAFLTGDYVAIRK
ncbi:MAG: hypothetical protein ABL993_04490 [Vicinamibacterales bacterium]